MSAALTLSDQRTLAQQFAMSRLFKAKTPAELFVKIQAGQELGIAPFAAVAAIHVIDSKPVLSATLQAALVRKSPDYDYEMVTLTEKKCELLFSRKGKEIGRSVFTEEDAKAAGLLDGPNKHSWKKYRRNMLFSRAMGNGFRWYCPDLGAGTTWYAEDEIGRSEPVGEPIIDVVAADGPSPVQERVAEITALVHETGASLDSLLTYYGVTDLVELVADPDNYQDALNKLHSKQKVTNDEQGSGGVLQGDGSEVADLVGGQGPGQTVLGTDVRPDGDSAGEGQPD